MNYILLIFAIWFGFGFASWAYAMGVGFFSLRRQHPIEAEDFKMMFILTALGLIAFAAMIQVMVKEYNSWSHK